MLFLTGGKKVYSAVDLNDSLQRSQRLGFRIRDWDMKLKYLPQGSSIKKKTKTVDISLLCLWERQALGKRKKVKFADPQLSSWTRVTELNASSGSASFQKVTASEREHILPCPSLKLNFSSKSTWKQKRLSPFHNPTGLDHAFWTYNESVELCESWRGLSCKF